MDIKSAIQQVTAGVDLSQSEMEEVMRIIMRGEATPAQIGGLLIGLRMKGETVDELTAAASVMREFARHVEVDTDHLVDTAGTGGDNTNTFNISTAAAIVAAAAGAHVAKHGNRSVSSSCGSADVLEAAGVNINLEPDAVARSIESIGIGFMFAPGHHGATRHAAGPRRELGVRTLFNALGPLTCPAAAPNQIVGIFSREWVERAAEALRRMGSRHVMVFHADDGLDEISIGADTYVAELRDGNIDTYTLQPQTFGFQPCDIAALTVNDIDEAVAVLRSTLANEPGPARDIVCLNAGAAIYVSGLAADLGAGVDKASEVLASGRGAEKFQQLIELSQQLSDE